MANALLGYFQTIRRGRVVANDRSGASKQPVGFGKFVLVLVLVEAPG
jgi:F0F1-type ATP synthase membrane subunit c/vacuolar-type H+-ATPase subunit K